MRLRLRMRTEARQPTKMSRQICARRRAGQEARARHLGRPLQSSSTKGGGGLSRGTGRACWLGGGKIKPRADQAISEQDGEDNDERRRNPHVGFNRHVIVYRSTNGRDIC